MESIISEEDRKRRRKKELIQEAFHQLMKEKKQQKQQKQQKQKGLEEEEEEDLLISRLLSKLDSVERDGDSIQSNSHEREEPEPEPEPESQRESSSVRKSGTEEADLNEMAKDLRIVKRQNLITHCLLSVIVVGIAVWQFNEVSILLAVRDMFSNPLRAVGDKIKGSINWRKQKKQRLQFEVPPLPAISISEFTRRDLPNLQILNNEDSNPV